jgi:hypothetical protein
MVIGWLSLLAPAYAATNSPAHTYPSGMDRAVKIGNDLYAALDPSFQTILNPNVVSTQPLDAPVLAPLPANRRGSLCQVSVSTGFIDLINHVAHAKAIDRIQPGYFSQYAAQLSQQSENENPALPPNLEDSRYWTDDVMNDQAGYFNQMVGLTLAVNLSHLYLAHCDKYAAQLTDGKWAPINNFITPEEWKASVLCATLNSLDCANATAGAESLFGFIDQMPRRPAWTGYVVPPSVDIKSLNKQLTKYEYSYFHGGLKLSKLLPAMSSRTPAMSVAFNPNR